jgi:hypothetical protein
MLKLSNIVVSLLLSAASVAAGSCLATENADTIAPPLTAAQVQDRNKQIAETLVKKREEAKKRYQEDKILLETFEVENKKFYGDELWGLISQITHDSVHMLEKHYDGVASVDTGAECLNKLRAWRSSINNFSSISQAEQKELTATLTRLRDSCSNRYQDYKKAKKSKEIVRQKRIDGSLVETVIESLHDLFSDNAPLQDMLTATLDSQFMYCHPKGGSIGASWFFGASLTYYRLMCHTKLGSRFHYTMMAGTANAGWSAFMGKISEHQHYYEPATDRYFPLIMKLPYDSSRVKVHPDLNIAAAIGVGAMLEVNGLLDTPSWGVGLGYSVGAGLGTLFKLRDLPADYRPLYSTMGLELR